MKVFISWSGEVSSKVAEILRDWLPSVIQAIDPYVSSEDMDKGARWSADISKELEESQYGILCVTKANLKAPWLNFEAGALSKSFDKSRVSPFLFGIGRNDVTGPLLQFQSTVYEKDDVLKLIRSINNSCESSLDESRLEQIFAVWWPSLKQKLDAFVNHPQPSSDESSETKRSIEDVLGEVLTLVRSQQKILADQSELQPLADSIARSHVLEMAKIRPLSALHDLNEAWMEFSTELAKVVDTFSDEAAIRRLMRPADRLDAIIDYVVGGYEMRPRERAANRRTNLNRENATKLTPGKPGKI